MREIKALEGPGKHLKPLLISVGIGAVFGLIFLLICAIILTVRDIPAAIVAPLSSVSTGIGALACGFCASRMIGRKGLYCGLAGSGILFLFVTIIGMVLSSFSLTVFTLIKLCIMLLCGAIGGISGINLSKKRKYI